MFDSIKLLKDFGRQEIYLALAHVPNTTRVVLGASDGVVYEVDLLAGEKPDFKGYDGHAPYVTGVAVAGDVIVSGGYDGKLIWDKLVTGDTIREAAAHQKWIRKVVASPDGKLVASVADDMVCKLWNAESGEMIRELRGHEERTPHHFPSMLYTCAFSADGQRLATADKVGHVVIWNVADGAKLQTFEATGLYTWDPKQRIHSIGGARSLAFSPDGKLLAVGGIGQIGNIDHLEGPARVEMFNLEKNEKHHEFSGDGKGLINQLIFSSDGNRMLGLGGDNGGLIQVYDVPEKKVLKSEKAPMHIHAAALSSDGKHLFAAGHQKVAVWEVG